MRWMSCCGVLVFLLVVLAEEKPSAPSLGNKDPLTPAEIDVLRLIAAGNTNKLIGDQLHITEDTVKARVKNILSKLDAHDRTHAVTIALKRGIIELS